MKDLFSLEICAGGGGQALGLEQAGFNHVALVENDAHACSTLRLNRPNWKVLECDLKEFDARPYRGIDLLAGGVPCPPFSKAGLQLGKDDERDLFPHALRIVKESAPRAVMLENVRGLLDKGFDGYRADISDQLLALGYTSEWRLLHAAAFGVPQLRPRVIMVAIRNGSFPPFEWPVPNSAKENSVGDALRDLMASRGWPGADEWSRQADKIAPTIVGGSKKHGGPDLGPTRAKQAWESLRVNAHLIGNEPPGANFSADGMPTLTVRMVARLQGFPDDWEFAGRKTNSYRQVGNAFPPPVARAVGLRIAETLSQPQKDHKEQGNNGAGISLIRGNSQAVPRGLAPVLASG